MNVRKKGKPEDIVTEDGILSYLMSYEEKDDRKYPCYVCGELTTDIYLYTTHLISRYGRSTSISLCSHACFNMYALKRVL